MKGYQAEIIRITSQEILLTLADIAMAGYAADFRTRSLAIAYQKWRGKNRVDLTERIRHLRRMGYIQSYVEGKERYYEITPKGLKRAGEIKVNSIKITRSEHWDGKWRLVIFDIKEKRRYSRDSFRHKLCEIGFKQIQKKCLCLPFRVHE